MRKGIATDIFNQLEQLTIKYEKLSLDFNNVKKDTEKKYKDQIKSLQLENQNLKYELKYLKESVFRKVNIAIEEAVKPYNDKIKSLEEANATLKKENTLLKKEVDRLKNQINKNSSNSSKPGSTDNTKPQKSGANLYNSRIKSGKSVGGQLGHDGKSLSKEKIENMINNNEVKLVEIHHTINGNSNKKPIVKYRLGIEVIPYVEKHIFSYDENVMEVLSKEFYTDVTYNENFKSLCIELGSYNVVAIDRLSDFVSVITNGLLNVSNGSICNFYNEFSSLSENVVGDLEERILNSKIIYTDETGATVNNKKGYYRNYSTEHIAIYKFHKCKGHDPIKEDNILPRFTGGIMGDHDTALYSYGLLNYECNEHGGRYLEELIQNVVYISWPKKMKELLYRINNTRNLAKTYGLKTFNKRKVREYIKEYDKILQIGIQENEIIDSNFYKPKAKSLLNRLTKYKDNHLAFVKDFTVPFSNNLSERDLRLIKIKTKLSTFRSHKGAECYANALTIIKTAKKRDINPFDAIKNVFKRLPVFT